MFAIERDFVAVMTTLKRRLKLLKLYALWFLRVSVRLLDLPNHG